MLTPDQVKLVFDDARARQAALVQLVLFTDQQAMGLLRLYVTLGLAAAAAAAAGFGSKDLPAGVSWGATAAVAMLLLGSMYCFRAMKSADLTLPGRGADFWIVANSPNTKFEDGLGKYLADLDKGQKADRDVNEKSAKSLALAKKTGVWAPAAALTAGLLAHAPNYLVLILP